LPKVFSILSSDAMAIDQPKNNTPAECIRQEKHQPSLVEENRPTVNQPSPFTPLCNAPLFSPVAHPQAAPHPANRIHLQIGQICTTPPAPLDPTIPRTPAPAQRSPALNGPHGHSIARSPPHNPSQLLTRPGVTTKGWFWRCFSSPGRALRRLSGPPLALRPA